MMFTNFREERKVKGKGMNEVEDDQKDGDKQITDDMENLGFTREEDMGFVC